jgi:hypothetical protein
MVMGRGVRIPLSARFIKKLHGVCSMVIKHVTKSHGSMDKTKESNTTNNLKL